MVGIATNQLGLNQERPANKNTWGSDDELWLTAAVEVYKRRTDSQGKTNGTDLQRTNTKLLKQLWQIAINHNLDPKEFINNVASNDSFKTGNLNDNQYLEKHATRAKQIQGLATNRKNDQGRLSGFSSNAAARKIYTEIDELVSKQKSFAQSKRANNIPKPDSSLIARDQGIKAPSSAPNLNVGFDLDVGDLTPNIEKTDWIKTTIERLGLDTDGTYNSELGKTLKVDLQNLNNVTLNKLWDIAEANKLNPKEFIGWMVFNTSLKSKFTDKDGKTQDLFTHANKIARSGYLVKPQARFTTDTNGVRSNYVESAGVKDFAQMIELYAQANRLENKIVGKLTVMNKETIHEDPISGERTTQVVCVDEAGKLHIMRYEGLKLKAYKCQAGVWTVGYGSTKQPNGQAVTANTQITKNQAEEWFDKDVNARAAKLREVIKVPLTQEAFNAYVSLSYNAGVEGVRKSKSIAKLNQGDLDGAIQEFLGWNKVRVNGVLTVSKGLKLRREAEARQLETARALIATAKSSNTYAMN